MTRNQKDPKKESSYSNYIKIQRRRPLSDLKRQKKESIDVKSSDVQNEEESDYDEIFVTPKAREEDDTTQDTKPQRER